MTLEEALGVIEKKDAALKMITALPLGPGRANAQYQIDTAVNIARNALKAPTRELRDSVLNGIIEVPKDAALRYDLTPYLPRISRSAPDIRLCFRIETTDVPL